MNSSSFNETHLTTTPLLHISNHKPLSGSKLTSPLTTLSLNTLQSNHLNSISPSLSLSPSSTSLSSCLSPLSSSSLNSSSFLTSPTKHASNLTPNSAFSPSTPSTPSVFSKIIPLTPANKYPTFKDSSPFNTFIEAFISKLTHLSSPTQIATLFLEAAETIDTEFQYVPSLFPLGIPTFSSFQYNWQSNPTLS
ncbi:hypothetical protein HMI56_005762 [Coelomomyces lativittatus]|nr:hypothetical protein HMI56_005762 [Coelomomyces lativittatus]